MKGKPSPLLLLLLAAPLDRMIVEPDTVIPLSARVVSVPIPILWPIDLISLPRRGPRPTLREETRLTLKVMDDLGVPAGEPATYQQSPSLLRRENYQEPAPPPPRVRRAYAYWSPY